MEYASLVIFVLIALSVSIKDKEWQKWKEAFGKRYKSDYEEITRRQIWESNVNAIQEIQKQVTFTLSLNDLSDRLPKELVKPAPFVQKYTSVSHNPAFTDTIPKSFDWRDHGVISPVKNQGQCGNVESIVATECVASFHAIHTGHLLNLSVQQVADCCCKGPACAGSYCPEVFKCIHKIGGLCTEHDYPPSPQRKPCRKTCKPAAQIHGAHTVLKGNETDLQLAVLQAPVFVGIDASHTSFQMYQSGIYIEPKCSSTLLDHVLQLVGYGSKEGQDFWICKNSWGAHWGMKGYILMARNHNNMCGIASMAQVPF